MESTNNETYKALLKVLNIDSIPAKQLSAVAVQFFNDDQQIDRRRRRSRAALLEYMRENHVPLVKIVNAKAEEIRKFYKTLPDAAPLKEAYLIEAFTGKPAKSSLSKNQEEEDEGYEYDEEEEEEEEQAEK